MHTHARTRTTAHAHARTRTTAHAHAHAHAMYLSLRGVLWCQTSLNKITHIVHEQDLLENPQMNNSEFSIF